MSCSVGRRPTRRSVRASARRRGGYAGGYSQLTEFLRQVRPAASAGFERRFETLPGQQAQVELRPPATAALPSGATCSATRSSPPRCSIGCCTTPWSCKSTTQASSRPLATSAGMATQGQECRSNQRLITTPNWEILLRHKWGNPTGVDRLRAIASQQRHAVRQAVYAPELARNHRGRTPPDVRASQGLP